MLVDYLKYIVAKQNRIPNISEDEHTLINILDEKYLTLNDDKIISRLKALKVSNNEIMVTDFGAGSKKENNNIRLVRKIAKYASISPKHGRLFSQIIEQYNIDLSIELGTSLGIGTAYLARSSNKVITMEGCPETAKIAQETFHELNIQNVNLVVGEFSNSLNEMDKLPENPIFIYIDGNHKLTPTLEYFDYFKAFAPQNSIIVFDDIYWSREMKKAWRIIQSQNYLTIDMYRLGIVFLKDRTSPARINRRY
ncbi:MAG: O-methyltransferase [Crocinitomicaceae bacterium]